MPLEYILRGLQVTLSIAAAAFALAAVLAGPLALARRSSIWAVRSLARVWVTIARGIPPLVFLVVLYAGLTVGPTADSPFLAAVVGLGFIYSAYFGDSIRAGLDIVPKGQWEACKALSLPRIATYRRVILPQSFSIMLSSITAYSISLIKITSIASIIGANEIVFYAYNNVQLGRPSLESFLTVGVVYLIFTIPIGFFSRWLEGRSVIARTR